MGLSQTSAEVDREHVTFFVSRLVGFDMHPYGVLYGVRTVALASTTWVVCCWPYVVLASIVGVGSRYW